MKFLDWYVEISAWWCFDWSFYGILHDQDWLLYDKVTVLESDRRSWGSSPEAQAIGEALNPWRNHDTEERKNA
ncbi:hypothetical protein NC653_019264 [Populus alba x Populus x berolinensis]|uniref:Uncharacterized protein n=1 Tax=Populus alba x Populus x berolinensis TaxID=444605 RepID=A0AAD6QIN5_9ROSI|nr:hypothetical protein NC653_019264 [Populus alba x Populus x berolinensis]